ncbi:MAG: RNA methyltransferase [Candidatus Latescibacteria bacterium]|nr:RNA methyltransferase [Candidatus Latescibacterota bacterium]
MTIVLVEPHTPGNIGSTARAMKNMGLSQLTLVKPVPFNVPETYCMGYGAEDLIRGCRVVDSLQAAVSDAALVVGTTHRQRRRSIPVYPPQEAVRRIVETAAHHPCAILFGREDKGLFNEELDFCQILSRIPTACRYPSLNLSQAVMIFAYEIFTTTIAPLQNPALDLAPFDEIERLYERIDRTMTKVGFISRNTPDTFMRSVRRVFGRTQLERRDVATLHKICAKIEWYVSEYGPKTESSYGDA